MAAKLVASVIYDATGGYTPFIIAGSIGCLFCGALIISLPRYPDWGASSAYVENDRVTGAPASAI